MYSLVRRFIKTGVFFLIVGFVSGAWAMVGRELTGSYPSQYLISAHTHVILVGFMMSMIMGVALWLFPRPEKTDVRYRPALASASWWLLTIGTSSRFVGELLRQTNDSPPVKWVVTLSGLIQIAAVLLFFHTMWSRIRGVGSPAREARGERF